MTIVTTRTFCCCIPVRAGVILLGLIGLLGGGAVSVVGIINLKKDEGSKTATIIQIVVYITLTLLSTFGLIGAIGRKLTLVRVYFGMLVAHLIFSMAGGMYAIHRNFKEAPKYIQECASGSANPALLKSCKDGATLVKGVMVGVFIVAWLVEIWACLIVYNYNLQLAEEDANRHVVKDTEAW